jgi:enamine deaminase RidA (YjgF/YER057c/UK114 family)
MQKFEINPTQWMRAFSIHHGIEVQHPKRFLFLSGQTSNADDGSPLHAGDMRAQFRRAWSNLKDALLTAEMGPENVVRLTVYVTDMDAFVEAAGDLTPLLVADGAQVAMTLIGISRLFQPELLIEIEAIAAA